MASGKSATFFRRLGRRAADCREVLAAEFASRRDPALIHWRTTLQRATCQAYDDRELADTCAQALLCAAIGFARYPRLLPSWRFIGNGLTRPLLVGSLVAGGHLPRGGLSAIEQSFAELGERQRAALEPLGGSVKETPELFDDRFYEQFLEHQDADNRKRHGVFYTPDELVRFVIQEVDRRLQSDFEYRDGLADTSRSPSSPNGPQLPAVTILDPALGGGAFLIEVVRQVRTRLNDRWKSLDWPVAQQRAAWRDYVLRDLLPRLCGVELMLPAAVLAEIQLAACLQMTLPRRRSPGLPIWLANALSGTGIDASQGDANYLRAVSEVLTERRHTVIVGNPPFNGISANREPWIDQLLRDPGPTENGSYYHVDGQPLGERKLWLQDDYVKFLRYAQWQVDRAGAGIVGLVTNHGYLDNPTFRGVRESLLSSFARIAVIDLHGNPKKRETPRGQRDQGVFAIAQGVCVGLLSRRGAASAPSRVERWDVWGSRDEKLGQLERLHQRSPTICEARPPLYLFAPRSQRHAEEYRAGTPLNQIMPVNTTAPVSARDHLVVGFRRDELIERLAPFADLRVSDQEIRERYFPRPRSQRYPAGDTRGWRLSEARQEVARDDNWARSIRSCLYRPFDWRQILWSASMIDWPRLDVMQHLTRGSDNLALIARRQAPPEQPGSYIWSTNQVAMDGVIRSDNRGSESLFPLFLGDDAQRAINLEPGWVAAVWSHYGETASRTEAQRRRDARTIAAVIYAQFHSPAYRSRYCEELQVDFPRVFIPKERALFRDLAQLGSELLDQHLAPPALQSAGNWVGSDSESGRTRLCRPFPRFEHSTIWLSRQLGLSGVEAADWEFRVGAYQVCRKWLVDRRDRELNAEDLDGYQRLVGAVVQTRRLARDVDRTIEQHGGWPGAFLDHTPLPCPSV